MESAAGKPSRVFKTAWFSKASAKAGLSDAELCAAVRQVMLGQCDDLGGGVYKKRLGKNLYRSIVVAKGGGYWVYAFLFAKKDRANIDKQDLMRLRALAEVYARKTEDEIDRELRLDTIAEICNDQQTQISK